MTFAQMVSRAQFLAAQAGWSDASPPDGYDTLNDFWKALVNEAYQEFAFDTEYNIETDTFASVADQAEYRLADVTVGERGYIKVSEAVYSTDTPLSPTTEEEIRRRDHLWLMAEASTPVWYWTSTSGVFRLHPAPSTGDVEITVRGPREVAPLILDYSSPTCPQAFHIAIPIKAVLLMSEAWMEAEMDLARIAQYEASYALRASKLKRHAGDDDAEVQRYVTPRLPRRVPQTLDASRGY